MLRFLACLLFAQFYVGLYAGDAASFRIIDRQGSATPLGGDINWVGGWSGGIAPVRIGEKYGAIGPSGVVIVKPEYDSVGPCSDGLIPVRINSNWKYIDLQSRIIIPGPFIRAGQFHGGLARVSIADKRPIAINGSITGELTGFIDKKGQTVLAFRDGYYLSRVYNETVVTIDGIFSLDGKVILAKKTPFFRGDFSAEGKILGEENGMWYLCDASGSISNLKGYDSMTSCGDGYIVARKGGKFGYCDYKGKSVIEPKYDSAGPFRNGVAAVANATGWFYIDKSGNMAIASYYCQAGDFSDDGHAVVK